MVFLERLLGSSTLSSFQRPGFVWLWLSLTANGFTNTIAAVTFGWLALEITGSPVAVGTILAVRNVPRLLFAVPIGALSDRMDRRRMLQGVNLFGAALALSATGLAFTGNLTFIGLLVVAFLEGTFDAAETTLGRAFIYDLVGRDDAINGMALEQLANRAVGAAGAVGAGVLLAFYGASAPFISMIIGFVVAASALSMIPRSLRVASVDIARTEFAIGSAERTSPEVPTVVSSRRTTNRLDLKNFAVSLRGFTVLWRNRAVLLLAVIGAAAEAFAFSSDALLPSFSRDILMVGEIGLGNMVAIRQVGGVAALLILASLSARVRPGKLIFWMCGLFSFSLIAFAGSASYNLSLFLMLWIGVAWAAVDLLLPKLVQDRVPDSERGAAVGIWNLSRGAGPLGSLEVGVIAGSFGAPIAQVMNAGVFLVVVAVAALLQRDARWQIFGGEKPTS